MYNKLFDVHCKRNMFISISKMYLLFIFINLINISKTLNECGRGINLCETTIKMPWTKCYGNDCNSFRKRYTLRCCENKHKDECYKFCNITDADLILRELCSAPRCVNGFLDSGKCKCDNGYYGNCCDACPPAKYCENGGTCSMVGYNKTCFCTSSYHGNRCQHRGPSTSATTVITTKSMFTIKQTKATTFITYTTPMTTSANLLTTILGSTSATSSSTRRQTPNTIPTIKYLNTITSTNTTLNRPGLFRTVQTKSPWRIICIAVGIFLAFILMFVIILFVCKRLKSKTECAPVRE